MKTKFYLFIALAIVTSIVLKAQTTNYAATGRYIGTPIASTDPFEVNFSTWLSTDLPASPGISTYTEKQMVGFKNCYIDVNGTVTTTGNVTPPNIVFPTFANGVDRIEIEFTNTTSQAYIHYWKESVSPAAFGYLKSVDAGAAVNSYTINANYQLGILQRGGTWTAIRRITIYPKSGTPTANSEIIQERAFLSGNTLKLKDVASQVNFYSFSGALMFSVKNISGEIVLPSSEGIVRVTMNNKILNFKKL